MAVLETRKSQAALKSCRLRQKESTRTRTIQSTNHKDDTVESDLLVSRPEAFVFRFSLPSLLFTSNIKHLSFRSPSTLINLTFAFFKQWLSDVSQPKTTVARSNARRYVTSMKRESTRSDNFQIVPSPQNDKANHAPAHEKHLSLLELLPTELFTKIARQIPIPSVLALKLSSTTLNLKTKKSDGSEVTQIKEFRMAGRKYRHQLCFNFQADKLDWAEWLQVNMTSEQQTATSSPRLTCAVCGERKGHGLPNGFQDAQYKRKKHNRYCIDCAFKFDKRYGRRQAKVDGKNIFECRICLQKWFECEALASGQEIGAWRERCGVSRRYEKQVCKECVEANRAPEERWAPREKSS